MSSSLDKDFNGTVTLEKVSETELVYKKDDAILHFQRFASSSVASEPESKKPGNTVARLAFTEADFFNEDGDYKYYDDDGKLPWQDIDAMLMSLVNVKQLVYKFFILDEKAMVFNDKILSAEVNSNPSEQALSIDFIFYGYDRCNLPDDTELPPNTEYSNPLYPEEDNLFRVSGFEKITTKPGTFGQYSIYELQEIVISE